MQKEGRKRVIGALRCKAFTLIEVVLVIFFTTLVLAGLVLNHRRAAYTGSMERAANRFAQDIRRAQALALATDPSRYGSALPPCGFGVHAPDPTTGDADSYVIYAKVPSTSSVPCGSIARQWTGQRQCFDLIGGVFLPITCAPSSQHYISTSTVKSFALPEGGRVRFSSAGPFRDVYFEPPDPTTFVLETDPGQSVSSFGSVAAFELELTGAVSRTSTVFAYNSGRVEIGGGQLLSQPCVPHVCGTLDVYTYVCGSWDDGCNGSVNCGTCTILGDVCCEDTGNPLCNPTPGLGLCYPDIPADPTGLGATPVSETQINLTWTDNATNEAEYIVERAPRSGGVCGAFVQIASSIGPFGGFGSYASMGLSSDTEYCHRVKARNVTGDSGYSNEANARTAPTAPVWSGTRPTAMASRRLYLNWTDLSSSETHFEIERATLASPGTCGGASFSGLVSRSISAPDYIGPEYFDCDSSLYPAAATFGNPTFGNCGWIPGSPPTAYPQSTLGVTPNTLYCYRVRAFRASDGAFSTWATREVTNGKTPDEKPNVPTGLIANVVSNSQINVSWIDDPDLGYAEEDWFALYRCGTFGCDPSPPVNNIATIFVSPGNNPGVSITIPTPPAPPHPDTGLSEGVTYRYCVKSGNAAGVSVCSTPFEDETTLPAPPTLTAATSTGFTSAQINWQDNSAFETSNVIERGDGVCTPASFVNVATLGPVSGPQVNPFSGLAAETLYCLRVGAVNVSGTLYSNALVIRTQLFVPTGLTATPGPPGKRITLTWTDVSAQNNGYKIERCQGGGCSGFAPLTFTTSQTSYVDNTGPALSGLTFCYHIRATSPEVDSLFSSPVVCAVAN